MDAFYSSIEEEKKQGEANTMKDHIRSKFMKVKRGFEFMSLTTKEPAAKIHSELLEEQISKLSRHNAIDDWGLPSRPPIYKGSVADEYTNVKLQEDIVLNDSKAAQWEGNLREELYRADAFKCGFIAIHDIRRILLSAMKSEHVHNAEVRVEECLKKSDVEGDGINHDIDTIVESTIEVMLDSLRKHVAGEQIRAQKDRLEAEAAKKRRQHYWLYKEVDAKLARRAELTKMTPFNCPAFKPQPFNDRICEICKHDRMLHTVVHSKKDYEDMVLKLNEDAKNEDEEASKAKEIIARQEEVKRKLREQHKALGGANLDWEDTES